MIRELEREEDIRPLRAECSSEVTMPGLGVSKIHLKGRACGIWILGKRSIPTSSTCVKTISREREMR